MGWSVDHTIERSFGVYSKFAKTNEDEVEEKTEEIIVEETKVETIERVTENIQINQ